MPRPKRDDLHADMAAAIKTAAKAQMTEQGTAGLSLRAIARALDITAPAIYNYFPRLEDLITALIVDAYTDLTDAQAQAINALPPTAYRARMAAAIGAFREWALQHPTQFHLIYGNPIPGYHAPIEVTYPLARRSALLILEIAHEAQRAGKLTIPAGYQQVPTGLQTYMAQWMDDMAVDYPTPLLLINFSGWVRLHGMVMLELIGHMGPAVGDPDAFFQHEVGALLDQIGLSDDGS